MAERPEDRGSLQPHEPAELHGLSVLSRFLKKDQSDSRVRAARFIAVAADLAQIVFFPVFSEGIASVLNDALDFVVAAAMVALLGWHWAFLPTFLSEMIPLWDLVPTWTVAVFIVTRHKRLGGTDSPPPPA
jgi:hypothetical protein